MLGHPSATLAQTSGVSRRARCVFAATLVVAALTLACGGSGASERSSSGDVTTGPPLTLQAYFQRLSGAFYRFESGLSSDPEVSDPAGRGLSTLLEAMLASIEQLETATASFRDTLVTLNPPPDASEAHQSFIAAVERDLDSIQQARQNAEQTEDLNAIMETLKPAGASSPGFLERCLGLQAIADEKEIGIALPCEE